MLYTVYHRARWTLDEVTEEKDLGLTGLKDRLRNKIEETWTYLRPGEEITQIEEMIVKIRKTVK